ncbi:Thioredoxin reductase [hydrothermal vent metagenome]|uniref:Thioredoxin reductase n=1 Tax=hydrothermal vent metagenome TaxID=652676 RepID=A0A3B1E7R0_9ZZZZ
MLDLAIIGGGPAGLTAGLYSTRGGLKDVTMFELGLPGGQITQSSEIENYPGQIEVVTGMKLMDKWPKQCSRFGLEIKMAEVKQITKSNNIFTLILADKSQIQAKSVLIATGSVPKSAGIKGEAEFFGKGVSTCATCDGFFYKNKDVAVIGGGDTAVEEAIFLANICKTVYIIHRRDSFRASPHEVEKLNQYKNIIQIMNHSTEEIIGDNTGVTGIAIKSKKTNELKTLDTLGVFIFVGRDVLNQTLIQQDGTFLCDTNEAGEVVVDLKMRTSISGLFAAGDIRIDAPKQVVCAAGDGAIAGIEAISYLQ